MGNKEQTADFYSTQFKAGYSTERYVELYKSVARIVSGNVLDMGCGTGDFKKYCPNDAVYSGFDFTGFAEGECFKKGDIYTYDLAGYDWYMMLEVLEHVDDRQVLKRLKEAVNVVYSVPNFWCNSHVRVYDSEVIKARHSDLIDIKSIRTFYMFDGAWKETNDVFPKNRPCIYLVQGQRKKSILPKISAAMIVKNEESCIRRSLESIKDADEIIICDTGSTDKTIEIASEYGKVFTDYTWKEHFADARNHALSKCSGDWVFWVDADDYLATPFNLIREAVQTESDAVLVKHQSNKHYHYFPCLHKNKTNVRWKGAAHNYLIGLGESCQRDDIVVAQGHSINHKRIPDRTLNILKKEVQKHPNLIREKYYLAREYWYRSDYITAKYWYENYLENAVWKPEKADAHLMLARCLWHLKQGQEARVQCLEAIFINPDFKEAVLFLAEMHYEPMKSVWLRYSDHAKNKDVLFVRE